MNLSNDDKKEEFPNDDKKEEFPNDYKKDHIQEIIDTQIFGPVTSMNDFHIPFGQDKIPFSKFRESILQYKKDSKNFFVGDFLGQCSRKRRITDSWYPWNKDMITDVDRNESVMNKVLLEQGHGYVEDVMKNVESDGWNQSMKEMIESLMSNLESIEDRIDEGMVTIWGKIKDDGTVLNNIKSSRKKFIGEERKYDIIDYVNYKNKRWEEHYKKKKDKMERDRLYYQ